MPHRLITAAVNSVARYATGATLVAGTSGARQATQKRKEREPWFIRRQRKPRERCQSQVAGRRARRGHLSTERHVAVAVGAEFFFVADDVKKAIAEWKCR